MAYINIIYLSTIIISLFELVFLINHFYSLYRGNLRRSLESFEKAISLAKTELEMTHLFSLKDAAAAQLKVSERWGLDWTVS